MTYEITIHDGVGLNGFGHLVRIYFRFDSNPMKNESFAEFMKRFDDQFYMGIIQLNSCWASQLLLFLDEPMSVEDFSEMLKSPLALIVNINSENKKLKFLCSMFAEVKTLYKI
jgi:hypothetical protein